jgi:hypothetical protein
MGRARAERDVGDLARLQSPKCVRRWVNQILKDTGDIRVALGNIDPRVSSVGGPLIGPSRSQADIISTGGQSKAAELTNRGPVAVGFTGRAESS